MILKESHPISSGIGSWAINRELTTSHVSYDIDLPALGSSLVFADLLSFRDGEDPSSKMDDDPSSVAKGDSLVVFKEVLSLITGLFPAAKPSVSSNVDFSSWFAGFGSAKRCDPCVLLSLFDKLAPVMAEIDEKFRKASDDRKRATCCLPV